MSATPKVRDVVATALTDPGIVLDDVTVSVAGKRKLVRVTLDMLPTINADGSTDEPTPALSLDDVADLSRAISDALDRDEPFGGAAYVLEVSSPGVGRALREPRHYRRNVGRLLNVTSAGATRTGRILRADETQVVVEIDETPTTIAYAEVERAVIDVEFASTQEGSE
ncbi:ribosome maturation factor RimP [Nostocoides vanveenii]|uniref:Ribosome maturation factor RimP n=1 Tax=Nostocoides vanveenii TaxID=330835 RepID=A0ABN2K6M0_9MICO